jgi:hypothetical protein
MKILGLQLSKNLPDKRVITDRCQNSSWKEYVGHTESYEHHGITGKCQAILQSTIHAG